MCFQIRSDYQTEQNIEYSLEGIGASQYPFHVFVVDAKTGLIRVTKLLDREEIAMYNVRDTHLLNHFNTDVTVLAAMLNALEGCCLLMHIIIAKPLFGAFVAAVRYC